MQQQDTAHQDEIPYSSSREEAAAAAAEPTPSDLLQTAGHVEVPPGPAALSTAEHAVEAAAAAAKASDTATVTGGSSAGSASSSRDIDSPGPDSDVPDSPPWSPDGPDNTPPDPPDQPISGAQAWSDGGYWVLINLDTQQPQLATSGCPADSGYSWTTA